MTASPSEPPPAAPAPRRRPWGGRIAAALLGGSLLAFALGLAVTIYVPAYDGLDGAFTGGLTLVVAWPVLILWVLFAPTTWRAWGRVLVPFVVLLALSIGGLLR